MRQHFWRRKAKTLVVVLAAAMWLSGLATEVRAFSVNSGDLVLALYNNTQEYYRDLGPAASVLAAGANQDININSPLDPMSAVSGSNPVAWTLVRATFGTGIPQSATFINAGSQLNAQETLDAGNNYSVIQANSAIRSWISQLGVVTAPLGDQVLVLANNQASFTSTMGLGGSLNGSFTGFGMEGGLGSTLSILQGVAQGNALSDAGRAVLTNEGHLLLCGGAGCTPSPVPLPPAVVLFGAGLIGLVGIARRKLKLMIG